MSAYTKTFNNGQKATVISNKSESIRLFIHFDAWHWIRYIPTDGGLGMNEFTIGPFRLIWF